MTNSGSHLHAKIKTTVKCTDYAELTDSFIHSFIFISQNTNTRIQILIHDLLFLPISTTVASYHMTVGQETRWAYSTMIPHRAKPEGVEPL